jgi:hypothetical protein
MESAEPCVTRARAAHRHLRAEDAGRVASVSVVSTDHLLKRVKDEDELDTTFCVRYSALSNEPNAVSQCGVDESGRASILAEFYRGSRPISQLGKRSGSQTRRFLAITSAASGRHAYHTRDPMHRNALSGPFPPKVCRAQV